MFVLVILQNDSITMTHVHMTFSDALAEFHSELAYRAEGRTSTMCAILNRSGDVLKNERWQSEQVETNYEV